ncbi:MAG: hypothetical protein EHM46_02860, partial [Bacteroidetes bacterium]
MATPSFLLIVGDVGHILLSQASGQVTDLYYAEYDREGDFIPDVFYGRISVENGEQLQAIAGKILEYEQYLFPDPSFLGEALLVAGADGSFAARHGNGQVNYAANNYFNPARGILSRNILYPASDTARQEIIDLVSRGAGFVNYTGHGLYDGWLDPSFRQKDIAGLGNRGKYPLMVVNGCQTNVFSIAECFAESLLRAPGRGALAYIGCTSDSYWDEDFYWSVGAGPIVSEPVYTESSPGFFDRIFHLNGEEIGIWAPSLGEMLFGGNMAVQQSTSPRKKFYWEIYQLAGDPSLIPWFGVPSPGNAEFSFTVPQGARSLNIRTAPYNYAAVSAGGNLLDARHAGPDGLVTLGLPGDLLPGVLDVVITGQGSMPFTGEVRVGTPPGDYLELAGHSLSDESLEPDGLISAGESVSFDLVLVNLGAGAMPADTLVISSPSAGIAIEDPLFPLAGLPAGDTLEVSGAFRIRAADTAGDGTLVMIGLVRRGARDAGGIYIRERLIAPVLESKGIRWDDRQRGDGDGIPDPSEWLDCTWLLKNSGHFRTGLIDVGDLPYGLSPFDSLVDQPGLRLGPGEEKESLFRARVGQPGVGTIAWGYFTAGNCYRQVIDSFQLATGLHFEDFGTRGTGRFPLENDPAAPWSPDPVTLFSPPYSFRSGQVRAGETSRLSVGFQTEGAGVLSFAYRVSSEPGYDCLVFLVDSIQVDIWSGEQPWNTFTTPIGPGSHTVTWLYRKDHSVSLGEDAAWIDDIVFPADAFRQS